MIPFPNKTVSLPGRLPETLSKPQPKFKDDAGDTFKDCLLLHRLLIEGKDGEVMRRRQELSTSILKHTCRCVGFWSKVRF